MSKKETMVFITDTKRFTGFEIATAAIRPLFLPRDMIDAIRGGRKTVVRRIIRASIDSSAHYIGAYEDPEAVAANDVELNPPQIIEGRVHAFRLGNAKLSPQEFIGVKADYDLWDVLYVPEPWKFHSEPTENDLEYTVAFQDGKIKKIRFLDKAQWQKWYKYWSEKPRDQWLNPRFMPKKAARIYLQVTGNWAERLQDITEEQARAEGFSTDMSAARSQTAIEWYSQRWNRHIKPTDRTLYGWNANPMVEVTEFKVL